MSKIGQYILEQQERNEELEVDYYYSHARTVGMSFQEYKELKDEIDYMQQVEHAKKNEDA